MSAGSRTPRASRSSSSSRARARRPGASRSTSRWTRWTRASRKCRRAAWPSRIRRPRRSGGTARKSPVRTARAAGRDGLRDTLHGSSSSASVGDGNAGAPGWRDVRPRKDGSQAAGGARAFNTAVAQHQQRAQHQARNPAERAADEDREVARRPFERGDAKQRRQQAGRGRAEGKPQGGTDQRRQEGQQVGHDGPSVRKSHAASAWTFITWWNSARLTLSSTPPMPAGEQP